MSRHHDISPTRSVRLLLIQNVLILIQTML